VTRAFAGLAAAVLLAGCGGDDLSRGTTDSPPATTTQVGTPNEQRTIVLYLIDPGDHKLYAAGREIDATPAVGAEALRLLAEDPDSEVPPNLSLTIENGDAKVTGSPLSPAAEAQVVYTLTQFPTVRSVNGKTRQDVESVVPSILVEHPAAEERVTSPLLVTGNANTFEATFEYDLKDAGGAVLHHDFVTATSGSGERGTFEFSVPFRVDHVQDGTLIVYEVSAADGSRIHVREIPLTLAPG
jgi:hypothetical protein